MPQPVAARWTRANPAHGVNLDAKPGGDYRCFSPPPPLASTLACRSGRPSPPDLTTLGRPAESDIDLLGELQMPIKALNETL